MIITKIYQSGGQLLLNGIVGDRIVRTTLPGQVGWKATF